MNAYLRLSTYFELFLGRVKYRVSYDTLPYSTITLCELCPNGGAKGVVWIDRGVLAVFSRRNGAEHRAYKEYIPWCEIYSYTAFRVPFQLGPT